MRKPPFKSNHLLRNAVNNLDGLRGGPNHAALIAMLLEQLDCAKTQVELDAACDALEYVDREFRSSSLEPGQRPLSEVVKAFLHRIAAKR